MPACSQGPRVEKHAEAIDQEPRTKSHIQYKLRALQMQGRMQSQGPRAKQQKARTKSQRPRVTRTMSQGPCRSHAMDQEPRTKSQGPRDQPTILRYSGQHPTDSLKQILITQKMHALNIFFAKIPKFGRLHVLRL